MPRTNKFEKYGAIAVLILLISRILMGADLNAALRSGLTLISIFYMWFGFFLFTRIRVKDFTDKSKKHLFSAFRITSSILMGFCYSYCILAIMFSVFFLKGMQFMLGLSLFLLIATTALLLLFNWFNRHETTFLKQFYLRSALIAMFIFAVLLTPLQTRLKVFYRDHPDFVTAYMDYYQSPQEENAREALKEARSKFR
jgi:glucan phosphoethanolaminetransferase (alkaline phosphatase superfamily)